MAVFFHYVGAIAEVLGIVKLRRGGDLMGQDILLLDAKVVLFSKLFIIVCFGEITTLIL